MEELEALIAAATLRASALCRAATNRTALVLVKRVRIFQLLKMRKRHVGLHLLLLQSLKVVLESLTFLLQLGLTSCGAGSLWRHAWLCRFALMALISGIRRSFLASPFYFQTELVFVLLIDRGPSLDQLLHELTPIDVLGIDDSR